MSVHVMTSISGAPGVTTALIAWATRSPRPTLLIEADSTGGSALLAGPFAGSIEHEASLLSLLERDDPDTLAQFMWHVALPLPETTDTRILSGPDSHTQATALLGSWPHIARASATLSASGMNVLVDLGRYYTEHTAHDLLAVADTIIVLTATTAPALTRTRWALDDVRQGASIAGSPDRVVTALTRTIPEHVSYPTRQAGPALQATVVGELPWSPDVAAVYAHAQPRPRRFEQSAYNSAIDRLADAAEQHVARLRAATRIDPLEDEF